MNLILEINFTFCYYSTHEYSYLTYPKLLFTLPPWLRNKSTCVFNALEIKGDSQSVRLMGCNINTIKQEFDLIRKFASKAGNGGVHLNPRTWESDEVGALWLPGQSGLN